MLGTLESDKKINWKALVSSIVHAYNCTRNEATGFSPFYLMYGRHPHLPVDLILGIDCRESSYRLFFLGIIDCFNSHRETVSCL